MEFLKVGIYAVLAFATVACAPASTFQTVDFVESDTYISSADGGNHANDPTLHVSSGGGLEERALLKLPTGDQNNNGSLITSTPDDIGQVLAGVILFPFYIALEVLSDLFSCDTAHLVRTNLVSASFEMDVLANSLPAGAAPVELDVIGRPWYQTANWQRAHPFSLRGTWSTAGGDLDASIAPAPGTVTAPIGGAGSANSTVAFDITHYMTQFLPEGFGTGSPDAAHYGFMIKTTSGASLSPASFASAQGNSLGSGPRVVSTYTCPAGASTNHLTETTYYIGSKNTVITGR